MNDEISDKLMNSRQYNAMYLVIVYLVIVYCLYIPEYEILSLFWGTQVTYNLALHR